MNEVPEIDAQQKITIFVNGRARRVDGATRIADLADSVGLSVKGILVELNGEALLRSEWENRALDHGDRLELIRVVAGG